MLIYKCDKCNATIFVDYETEACINCKSELNILINRYKKCPICRKIRHIFNFDSSITDDFNIEYINKICNKCNDKKLHKNFEAYINYKIACNLRSRLYCALKSKNAKKQDKTFNLIGCTINELKIYLSKQFTEGMKLENYGEWHIDHIIPCANFDLNNEIEQRKCFHYSNLQPLWAIDNMRKGKKLMWKKITQRY
jgi:hypothetical protein